MVKSSLIPRPSYRPVFDHMQSKTGWWKGLGMRPGKGRSLSYYIVAELMYMVAIILKRFMHQYSGKFRWWKFLQNASRHSRRNFSVFIFAEHEPFTVSWVASVSNNFFKGRVKKWAKFSSERDKQLSPVSPWQRQKNRQHWILPINKLPAHHEWQSFSPSVQSRCPCKCDSLWPLPLQKRKTVCSNLALCCDWLGRCQVLHMLRKRHGNNLYKPAKLGFN